NSIAITSCWGGPKSRPLFVTETVQLPEGGSLIVKPVFLNAGKASSPGSGNEIAPFGPITVALRVLRREPSGIHPTSTVANSASAGMLNVREEVEPGATEPLNCEIGSLE